MMASLLSSLRRHLGSHHIRGKLYLLSFFFLMISAALVVLLVHVQQQRVLRTQWVDAMTTQAHLIATDAQAAVAFMDHREATRLLASLRANPAVVAGRLLMVNGLELAHYQRQAPPISFPAYQAPYVFLPHHLMVSQTIVDHDGRSVLGRVDILASLDGFDDAMAQALLDTVIVVAAALVVSLLITRLVVRRITLPLERLHGLVAMVAADVRTPERVPVLGEDEIGSLGRAFNEMLDNLQARDAELDQYRATLESRVAARTKELHRTLEELRSANRAKSEFLARMSHEIRTPMNAIIGLSRIIQGTPLTEGQRQHLNSILASAEVLLGIINDVLDYSKIEAGRLQLENRPFRLQRVFHAIESVLLLAARNKGLALHLAVSGDVPPVLSGDALRLGQVLINLLGNGIKFTEQGEVSLYIERLPVVADAVREGQVCLSFVIRDTGIGIPPDQQKALFAPFAQADSSITRRFGGTGLGLAICRQLVGMMGGDIHLLSLPGEGSEFRFTAWFGIPAAEAMAELDSVEGEAGRDSAGRIPSWPGLKVLLVEDVHINQVIAVALLEACGLQVTVAGDGQEGLNRLAQATHADRSCDFALVLMDLQMPEMDGLTATRLLRQDARWSALPVVAMTAHALAEDRQQCLAVGMNDHVGKPIDAATLYATLCRWLPPPVAYRDPPRPADDTSASHVLPARVETGLIPGGLEGIPGLDVARGIALHLQRPALWLENLQAFVEEYADVTERIADGMLMPSTEHAESLRRLAHSLKSAAAALGADAIAGQARVLEGLFTGPWPGVAQVEEALQVLRAQLQPVVAGVRACIPATSRPVNAQDEGQRRQQVVRLLSELRGWLVQGDARSHDVLQALTALGLPELDAPLRELRDNIDDVEFEAAGLQVDQLLTEWEMQ